MKLKIQETEKKEKFRPCDLVIPINSQEEADWVFENFILRLAQDREGPHADFCNLNEVAARLKNSYKWIGGKRNNGNLR